MKLKTSLLITVATGTFLCASSVVSYAGTSTPDTMGLFRKKKKTESNDSIKSKNEYEKLTGDGSIVRRGMFNVYQKKNDYYFEVPSNLLGRDLLVVNKLQRVPVELNEAGVNRGVNYENQMVRFELDKATNKLLIRQSRVLPLSPAEDAISESVRNNYISPLIAGFKVEAYNNDSTAMVIKVNDIYDGTETSINNVFTNINLGTSAIKNLSRILSIKSFENNVVATSELTTKVTEGTTSVYVTVEVSSSLMLLPEKPMTGRLDNARVGYFTNPLLSYSDGQQKVEEKQFITRWRLEPKPEDRERYLRGELVEPAKPIVFYIENSTPYRWRKYIKQGIEDWQVAFERAGFKNAIIAKEVTDSMIIDMDDVNYSVLTYAASTKANAMGPSILDPRSGEILEADIMWWHNVLGMLQEWITVQTGAIRPEARGVKISDELMGDAMRFVACHEVGHSLGLRHNMMGSWAFPTDSLRSKTFTDRMNSTSSSIMDYARFNYVAQPEDGISREGIFPRIGDYDKWAIQWGYAPMLGATDEDSDHLLLESLMEKNLEKNPRLWFGDGETNSVRDPRCQTEDLGDDAVKASEYGIRNLKREIRSLQEWTLDADDIYNRNLAEMYNQIVQQFMRYNGHVMAWIGGMYNDFKTPGQYGDIYTPVPKARQKEALEYINRNVFTEPTWLTSERYMSRITPTPQKVTVNVGLNALSRLTDSYLLNNMNTEYSVYEYLKDLTSMLFSGTDMRSRMSGYRMALQASFVRTLVLAFETNPRNAACRPAVLQTLRTLRDFTSRASAAAPDGESRAHYASLNDVLQRALLVK